MKEAVCNGFPLRCKDFSSSGSRTWMILCINKKSEQFEIIVKFFYYVKLWLSLKCKKVWNYCLILVSRALACFKVYGYVLYTPSPRSHIFSAVFQKGCWDNFCHFLFASLGG